MINVFYGIYGGYVNMDCDDAHDVIEMFENGMELVLTDYENGEINRMEYGDFLTDLLDYATELLADMDVSNEQNCELRNLAHYYKHI